MKEKEKDMNYYATFIQVASDCKVTEAVVPPVKGDKKTVANLEFDMLYNTPYKYTQEDILFLVHALRAGIPENEYPEARKAFYAKPQACLRACPLAKTYGWGIHFKADGKAAIYAVDSEEYKRFTKDSGLQQVPAMRSKRA